MTFEAPDEHHKFWGWYVERFGNRYFVMFGYGVLQSGFNARYEISAEDFEAAKRGQLSYRKLFEKYNTDYRAFFKGLVRPPLWIRICLIVSLLFFLVVGAAVAFDWIVYDWAKGVYTWKPTTSS